MKKNISNKLTAGMAVGMSALSMVGGVAPIFAASTPATVVGISGEQADVANLKAQIKVTGIAEATKVVAYQLVDGYYDNNNLVRYVLTDPANAPIASLTEVDEHGVPVNYDVSITTDEITAIANKINAGELAPELADEMNLDAANGEATLDVEPGLYLILVSGADDTVYNPAVVAVNLDDANDLIEDVEDKIVAGTVNLNEYFKFGEEAYVKTSKSDMDKNIVANADVGHGVIDSTGEAAGKGDTVAVGDKISFKIDNMTIPSFSRDYEAPKYIITDTLEDGMFEKISNLVVKVDGEVLPESVTEDQTTKNNYFLTWNADSKGNKTGFVIDFAESYLRDASFMDHRPVVEVTYDTALLDTDDADNTVTGAGMNFAENFNHVKLEYSNNPADQTSFKEIVKNTYHYTFAIDGLLDGDVPNDDINKIEYAMKGDDTEAQRYELADAKFAISMNEDMSEAFAEADSDEFGRFKFEGLDEGVYYIKEIDSPHGYTLNDNTYRATISAELDKDTGIMLSYTIAFESKASNADGGEEAWEACGTMTYTNTIAEDAVKADGDVVNNIAVAGDTTDVVNTKIQNLPSTGGAGTAVAFGVSAALAATTGGIVVAAKKKNRQ